MNRHFGGPPPQSGFSNNIFPFVLGGVFGSLLTNNRRQNYYPIYYYPYPYYPNYYNNYYRY